MRYIIFDFDGVIHDTFEIAYEIVQHILPGISRIKYRKLFNGNILHNDDIKQEQTDLFFRLQEQRYKELVIDDKVRNVLQKLSIKYTLFIISSSKARILYEYLERNNVKIFAEVLGYEFHKSKTAKFKYLFKKYHFKPSDCVFITDTVGDILEAREAGTVSIAVDYGYQDRKQLELGKPYKIISHISELISAINNIN